MSGYDIRHISLGLYDYLCRHVVGTEETVRIKRLSNNLQDMAYHNSSFMTVTSGSFGEGLEMKGSDIDYMYVLKDVVTFQEKEDIEQQFDKAYFKITTDVTKPGFVRLLLKYSETKMLTDSCEKIGNDFYLSNTLFKNILMKNINHGFINTIHGPCLSDEDGLFDFAVCLRYHLWISQANQWIYRANHEWPSNHLKTQIVQHGVLFVPIGVKGSPNEDIEWRISFSVGEKLLIHSFTHTQLLCYALMKIVLKDLINTDPECKDLLCSYFIKNIIFWISEELPLYSWRPDNLVICFMQCLERLIYCVDYSLCIHYFIPENNMFENRIEGEKRRILLNRLTDLRSFNWHCLLFSPQLKDFPYACQDIEARLNDNSLHIEQIMTSKGFHIRIVEFFILFGRLVGLLQRNRSTRVRQLLLRNIAMKCYRESESVQLCSTNSNKNLYRQYRHCQCNLMLSLQTDAVSGWFMVSPMFYKLKQYHKALDVLSYVLKKCTPEKYLRGQKLSLAQLEHLRTNVITRMGLVKALNFFFMDYVKFNQDSSLIPNELEIEVVKYWYIFPPMVYGHFLSFLCYYHLHDRKKCQDSLNDIMFTISHEYSTGNSVGMTSSYNCLGIAFQLMGEVDFARQAFMISAELDDSISNYALQRLSMLEGL